MSWNAPEEGCNCDHLPAESLCVECRERWDDATSSDHLLIADGGTTGPTASEAHPDHADQDDGDLEARVADLEDRLDDLEARAETHMDRLVDVLARVEDLEDDLLDEEAEA